MTTLTASPDMARDIACVAGGLAVRVCQPGRWRVWRDDDGSVTIETLTKGCR